MSAADAFWAAPPITRTLTAASVVLSFSTWIFNIIPPGLIVFIYPYVFTYRRVPQLWRLITSFLLSGQGLGLISDPYFLWTYGVQLERDTPRFSAPGDFFVFILFACAVIVLVGGYLLRAYVLLSPLLLAMTYIWSIDHPEQQVSFVIITIRGKYLPYARLGLTLLMAGPGLALQEASGLVAGHAYDFLTRLWPMYGGGRNYITTPAVAKRWFTRPGQSSTQRGYGQAFAPRTRQEPAQAQRPSGWTTGFTGSGSWSGRGAGHRLGGD